MSDGTGQTESSTTSTTTPGASSPSVEVGAAPEAPAVVAHVPSEPAAKPAPAKVTTFTKRSYAERLEEFFFAPRKAAR